MQPKSSLRHLLLTAGILIAFLLIAGSLSQFELGPGLRISSVRETAKDADIADSTQANSRGFGRFLNWLISLAAGLGVILFFVGLVKKESRAATIQIIVIGLVISSIFILITPDPSRQNEFDQGGVVPSQNGVGADSDELITEMPETAVAESPPKLWSWSLLLIIPTLAGLILIARPRWLRRRREQLELEELRTAATDAAQVILEDVENFANVVVQCYLRMVAAIEETHAVHRERGMTAREFEARLIQIGADAADVAGLTRLFELYRYGAGAPAQGAQSEAEGYLRRIASALGEPDA